MAAEIKSRSRTHEEADRYAHADEFVREAAEVLQHARAAKDFAVENFRRARTDEAGILQASAVEAWKAAKVLHNSLYIRAYENARDGGKTNCVNEVHSP